jgi:hypothetical protein
MKKAFVISALLTGGALLAAPATASGAKQEGNQDDKIVCKREAASVGTRLGGRVCLTRAQWKERETVERDSARQAMEKAESGMNEWQGPTPE